MQLPDVDELHVWRGLVEPSEEPENLALLSADELLRFERLRRPEDRARFASAHAGLRRVLAGYVGTGPAAIRFGRERCPRCGDEKHGRPFVLSPHTELSFNLSHSGDRWMVAIAPYGPVGMDVERAPDRDLAEAAAQMLTASERLMLPDDPQARQRLLLRAWTRKEAVCKAIGAGLTEDVRSIDVRPDDEAAVTVAYGLEGSAFAAWVVVDVSSGPEEYAAFARPAHVTTRYTLHEVAPSLAGTVQR